MPMFMTALETKRRKYFYNPMNLDTSRGVFFDYQDYIRVKDSYIVWANLTYMGYGFSALAVYTSSFANYHGRARTYYAHTWGSTNVTTKVLRALMLALAIIQTGLLFIKLGKLSFKLIIPSSIQKACLYLRQ